MPSTARPTGSTTPGSDLVVYVSGHGFGHATRTRAWLTALARRGGAKLGIRLYSEAPGELFVPPGPEPLAPPGPLDPGLLQPNGLDVDLEASLAAHQALAADWEPAVAREAARLTALGARLVVGDVPPLCFAAARRAGVPSLAVANFGWDWILDAYAASDPRWQPIAARYRDAYAAADLLLRLPLSGDLSAFRVALDVPLLVNVSTRPRDACRRALGLAPGERRRVVLVSFGGFGAPAAAQADDDLSDYLFLGAAAAPPGLAAEWRRVRTSRELPHEDVIHACDAVIGKPGYGTVAEVVAHAARFLYLPRDGFRETAPLLEGLAAGAAALPMPREDFAAGRWRRHLDALFGLPLPTRRADTGGADAVADAILARLGRRVEADGSRPTRSEAPRGEPSREPSEGR